MPAHDKHQGASASADQALVASQSSPAVSTEGFDPSRGRDNFDCFRRAYIAEVLSDAAEAMPIRKRREFRTFLKSLPTGSVFDERRK